jgi:hypothetical protein
MESRGGRWERPRGTANNSPTLQARDGPFLYWWTRAVADEPPSSGGGCGAKLYGARAMFHRLVNAIVALMEIDRVRIKDVCRVLTTTQNRTIMQAAIRDLVKQQRRVRQ